MTNRERNSSTVSSDRVGRCAMSTGSFLSGPTRYLTGPNFRVDGRCGRRRGSWWDPRRRPGSLLRVVLDDELLLDRDVDLGPDGELVNEDPHPRRDRLEPRRDDALAVGLASHDEGGHLEGLLPHVDHVVRGHLVRRDV